MSENNHEHPHKHKHAPHMIGTAVKARHNTPIHQPGKRLMHSIPLRFIQKKVSGHGGKSVNADLNLTSMIDYLVITVVFLLSQFGTAQQVASQQGLEVPTVPHADSVKSAPVVSISSLAILLDGQRVANPREEQDGTGRIDRLFERLEETKRIWKISHPGEEFPGDVVFQIDRGTSWGLIRRVAITCSNVGYNNLNFAVQKGNGDAASGGPGG